MMPRFDFPWLLVLAIVLPAVTIVAFVQWHRRRRARLARLGAPALLERIVPPATLRPPRLRVVLLSLAAALAGIAIAGPRWGAQRTVVRGAGIDVVLALDASLSMLAADERPTRLERMKQEVRRFRATTRGDRIALIAFAGRSYILTPLTSDNGALDLFLDNLDPSVVGQAGSSLARAIRQGTDLLLSTRTGSDRALVVMSDGESFEPIEDVRTAAARAGQNGISVVTVGFGTTGGAGIRVREGNAVVDKRDENGDLVVTRYQPEYLDAAAKAGNGTFIPANATDKAGRVRRALSTLRTQQRTMDTGLEQTPRFHLFLIPALLLVLIDTILAERHGARRRAPAAAKTAAAAAQIYARMIAAGDRTAATLYNYGTALLAADSLARSIEVLDRVAAAASASRARDARTDELRHRALFNLGLAHLRRGLAAEGDSAQPALDAALASYKKVLLARPRDPDAKWNYELALREKQGGGGGGGGGGGEAPQPSPSPSPRQEPIPRPAGGLGRQRAEQILDNAAREEREVQRDKQQQTRADPPPGGKDWE